MYRRRGYFGSRQGFPAFGYCLHRIRPFPQEIGIPSHMEEHEQKRVEKLEEVGKEITELRKKWWSEVCLRDKT
jgi:hypothetical protein